MITPRQIGRLRLSGRLTASFIESVMGEEKALDLRRRPMERAGTKFTEALCLQLKEVGGPVERARLSYGKVAAPEIKPPRSIGGLLVEVDASEYQLNLPSGTRTPTVLVQPVNNPTVVLNPPATKVRGEVRFKVPAGTAPFRVRLI